MLPCLAGGISRLLADSLCCVRAAQLPVPHAGMHLCVASASALPRYFTGEKAGYHALAPAVNLVLQRRCGLAQQVEPVARLLRAAWQTHEALEEFYEQLHPKLGKMGQELDPDPVAAAVVPFLPGYPFPLQGYHNGEPRQ